MQTLEKIIDKRRSIRRFTSQDVEKHTLEALLEAARWAPSWGNSQCWELIVIRDREKKGQLSQILSRKNPATLAVKDAPLVLAICAKSESSGFYNGIQVTRYRDWHLFDLGLATQNICLQAHDLGLGSVIVGAFDHQKAEEILELPEGYEIVALIPIGYPDQNPSAPKRKTVEEFVHYEIF